METTHDQAGVVPFNGGVGRPDPIYANLIRPTVRPIQIYYASTIPPPDSSTDGSKNDPRITSLEKVLVIGTFS